MHLGFYQEWVVRLSSAERQFCMQGFNLGKTVGSRVFALKGKLRLVI
uniref:Uncharacterized protein n=1 Tax=Arundo donax TaxID=35708 RepID=A0A0A9GYA8_ARUDO